MLVEHDGRLLGAIAVRDELRPEAAEVIAALRRLGIRRIAMLTGDNREHGGGARPQRRRR